MYEYVLVYRIGTAHSVYVEHKYIWIKALIYIYSYIYYVYIYVLVNSVGVYVAHIFFYIYVIRFFIQQGVQNALDLPHAQIYIYIVLYIYVCIIYTTYVYDIYM